jgi:hypothetical protein
MVWLFLAAGAVSLVMTLNIGLLSPVYRVLFQNGFLWVNTHGLFSMWYLALALSMALFNRRLHWALRAALLLYAAGWAYWGFWQRTSWLSGWAPAFVAAAVVAFLRSKGLFALLLIIMVVAGGYYWQTYLEAEAEESGHTRLEAYVVNWRITGKHWLFGTGPAGYASYYMSYFPTEGMASHSNYIDLIAQTGIVGTVFFLWFLVAQAWHGYRQSVRFKNRGDFFEGLTAAVTAGTAGCIVAMGLGDWLLPFAYTQGIVGFDAAMINWFFMGALWALGHLVPAHPCVGEVACASCPQEAFRSLW